MKFCKRNDCIKDEKREDAVEYYFTNDVLFSGVSHVMRYIKCVHLLDKLMLLENILPPL